MACLTLCDLMDCSLARLFCPWYSPDKITGVGCHCLLQGIFLTQGSNSGLLYCRQILYYLSYRRSPHDNIAAQRLCLAMRKKAQSLHCGTPAPEPFRSVSDTVSSASQLLHHGAAALVTGCPGSAPHVSPVSEPCHLLLRLFGKFFLS